MDEPIFSKENDNNLLNLPQSPRYYSLDIWRGVACLMVIFYHAAFYEGFQNADYQSQDWLIGFISKAIGGMWIGVTIFFVISGYCIMATTDITRRKTNPVKQYFLRRFKRIYPPYWVFLALSALLVMVLYQPWPYLLTETHYPIPHPASLSLSQCIGNITLTETWRYHFFGEQTKFLIDSAWTLCYEEQFYAICGLILFLAPRQLFQITFWISIIVFFVRYFSSTLNIPVFGFFFDGRWLSFALGIMLYYKINYAYKEQTKWINAFLILSLIVIFVIEVALELPYSKWRVEMLVSLIFTILISVLHCWDIKMYNFKILRPVKFCGLICYSLYMIHLPIVKIVSNILHLQGLKGGWITLLVTIPISTITAILVSWLFYTTVEKRFLNKPQI